VPVPASRRFETTLRTNTPLTTESVNTSERPGSWQHSRVFYVAAAGILAVLALLALGTWRSVPERRSAGAAAKPDVHVPAGTHAVGAAVSGEAEALIPARTGHGSSVADVLSTPLPTRETQDLPPSAAQTEQDTAIAATSQAAETHEPQRAARVMRATHEPAPARPPSAPPARPARPSARSNPLEDDGPVRARPDPSLDRLEF
jgi:hypothetical protein